MAELNVSIKNISEGQKKAFEHMFAVMNMLGVRGCSRRIELACDGDGNFRPNIEIEDSFMDVGSRRPQLDPERRDTDISTRKVIYIGMNW